MEKTRNTRENNCGVRCMLTQQFIWTLNSKNGYIFRL